MRGRAVKVVVQLLDVLTVIPLITGEPKQTLLEDGILAVPHCNSEANSLMTIAYACDTVLIPAIRS
jgi:hypothetical protein